MSNLHDVTVTICTLNEAARVEEAVHAALSENPKEVVVVDGSSDDETVSIARLAGARVIVTERLGLAHQRRIAVDAVTSEYVALLDADHRAESGSLKLLVAELNDYGWDGIEAQILSVTNSSRWDAAMEFNFEIAHNFVGERRMIGTPCLYRTSVIQHVNFDPFFTAASDDTDLCYRLKKSGYRLGVGSAIVRQVHRSSRDEVIKKFLWYGKGDAQFVWKHPERLFSIVKHQLYTYATKRTLIAIRRGKPTYAGFFVLAGVLRHAGMLMNLAKMAVNGTKDANIVST
jgi:glycosyltransferase involved in cell wall biosynthesis